MLELHYPMIQFLIKVHILLDFKLFFPYTENIIRIMTFPKFNEESKHLFQSLDLLNIYELNYLLFLKIISQRMSIYIITTPDPLLIYT